MNCPSKQFIKPVLLASALGVGLMPAIGDATPGRGNDRNDFCGVTVFTGNNCSVCHSSNNANGNNFVANFPCPTPTPPPTVCTDDDGDGFNAEGGPCGLMDCNDADFDVKPSATEYCTDGIDNNCNNLTDSQDTENAVGCPDAPVCTDEDGDDFATEGGQCGPMDCDDDNSAVNPGASENCGDSVDNNCDGDTDAVDAACQAGNDEGDEEEEENRRDDDEEEEENRRRDDNDSDDDDERRDSRRGRRESRD
jgi:hypothetical protein